MRNFYTVHVFQYYASPTECNRLVPHWAEKFSSIKKYRARAKEIAEEIRTKRNNRCTCYVEVFKNGDYIGEYTIHNIRRICK